MFLTSSLFAQEKGDSSKPFSFLTHVPGDLLEVGKAPFQKKNLVPTTVITGTTVLLFFLDQPIIDGVGSFSKQMGLEPQIKFHTLVSIGNTTFLKSPRNLNSAFYQLGEPTPTLLLTGSFFLYGKIAHNKRAVQTSADLMEAFLTSGITVQLLKRITGRQAPSKATIRGGKWQPFPSFSKYQHDITNYDAFPSGHLATMMATVTVLAENYPEKKWIKPVGYSLIGLTAWAMLNNKVHWASDFPLGLGIGYLSGKIAARHHQKKEMKKKMQL